MKRRKILIITLTFLVVFASAITYVSAGSRRRPIFSYWNEWKQRSDETTQTSMPTDTEKEESDLTKEDEISDISEKDEESEGEGAKPTPVVTNETVESPYDSTQNDDKISSNPTAELDGKLSQFYQGDVGDCGAVSAIEALDNNSYGRNILNNLITVNNNGTYTLNFGAEKQTITQKEADGAYIRGDLDARIIEAGLQKAINVYDSCFAYQCFEVITGFEGNTMSGDSDKTDMMNLMERKTTSGEGIIAACDFTEADSSKEIIGDGGHSYSIKKVNSDEVVIVNPWDTGEDVVISRSWFESSMRYMTYVDDKGKKVDIFWNNR